METKKHIRQQILRQRDALSREEHREKSEKILEAVMQTEVYQNARILLIYVSYRSETETRPLILHALQEGKQVYCPRVELDGEMQFYRIFSLEDLEEGYRGIPEPPADQRLLYRRERAQTDTLMILPGAVFDRERNRIGYGKGYYDRYLATASKMYLMALCFDCQICVQIPAEKHDRRPDQIISESGSIAGDSVSR